MENNPKYYVPDIEELRVGYEMEVDYGYFTNAEINTWHTYILKGVDDHVKDYLSKGYYRTSYLTKEQIEAEGWKLYEINKGFYFYFDESDHTMQINDHNGDVCFSGEVKSINEFRYICKLLKI